MQISVIFESDVANAPAGFKACVNAACQYYDQLFTSPAAITIEVGYGTVNGMTLSRGALGESNFVYFNEDYGQVRAALIAGNAPGSNTLPANAPISGTVNVSSAEDQALALPDSIYGVSGPDGYVGFSSSAKFSYDPTQSKTPARGTYDFMGTVEHEISEVMGRGSYLNQSGNYGVEDLYRYAAAGVRQTGTGGPSYFSIDGGVTHLNNWNNVNIDSTGDLGDWSPTTTLNDSYNDQSSPGAINPVTGTDKTLMAALGWSVNNSVTPASAVTVMSAAAAVAAVASGQDAYVSVSDSGADVAAQLNSLQNLLNNGNLSAIQLTDSGIATLSLTPAQLTADAALLAVIAGNFIVSINGSAPNISVTGLAGHGNELVLNAMAASETATASGNGTSFTLNGSGSVDHLSNMTALQFSNFTDFVASQTPSSPGAVSSAQVTDLYSAVLDRLPDVPGLAYYEALAAANPTLPIVSYALDFISSPEYTAAHNYAQNTSGDTQFITDTYNNLLRRPPESGAVAYYLNIIAAVTNGLPPGTAAYSNALLAAHATVLADFSQSVEFLGDVQITAQHPADSTHWLILI